MKDGTGRGKGERLHQKAEQAAVRGTFCPTPTQRRSGTRGISGGGRGAKVNGRSSGGALGVGVGGRRTLFVSPIDRRDGVSVRDQ